MIIKNLQRLAVSAAVVTAMSIGVFATQASAADAKKRENVDYISVIYVDFKEGMREKALTIANESFGPASVKAGIPRPWVMHFQTGSWDIALFWDLKGGMAAMEWETSPNGIKWKAAFDELSGGTEKADAIYAKYLSYVARSKTEVGHHHKTKEEMAD